MTDEICAHWQDGKCKQQKVLMLEDHEWEICDEGSGFFKDSLTPKVNVGCVYRKMVNRKG